MNRHGSLIPILFALGMALAGCTSATPSPSAPPASQTESPAPLSGGDAECGAITLLTPAGEPVDLNGEWGGRWFSIPPSTGERSFILQVGECVWVSITDDQFRAEPTQNRSLLAQYTGRIGSDFSVSGDLVTLFRWVDPFYYGEQAVVAPVRMLIEFDEASGQIRLREDREPGVQSVRCPNPTMWCPGPTELVKLGDLPEASPGSSP